MSVPKFPQGPCYWGCAVEAGSAMVACGSGACVLPIRLSWLEAMRAAGDLGNCETIML